MCSSDLREAADAVVAVEMFLRIILEHRVVEPAEQPQRFALIADVLAVLEGQAGELAPLVGPALVPSACPDAARDRARQAGGREGVARAAPEVAPHLHG